jgi:hypothetical protein
MSSCGFAGGAGCIADLAYRVVVKMGVRPCAHVVEHGKNGNEHGSANVVFG